jgi:formamidopyrimidine-DNA glycosylase
MGTHDPEQLVYINQGGENPFSVYQKARCPRCEGPLDRITQQARSTFLCPRCQPPPIG